MNPGRLDRRVVLLRRTVASDTAGSPVETWVADAAPLWAQRVAVAGNESVASGANRSTVSSTYLVRYREDLAAADAPGKFRLRVDGRDHDLVAAIEDPANPRRSALILSLAYVQGEATLSSVPA
jgi:SPP1 family predicted phage head-tail adaptor